MKPIASIPSLVPQRPAGSNFGDDSAAVAAAATVAALDRADRFRRDVEARKLAEHASRAADPRPWIGLECDVPPRICADLDPSYGPSAHSAALAWNGTPWLLAVIGSRGTGKTYLGAAVLARLAAPHPPEYRSSWKGLWADCVEALDAVRGEIGTDRDGKTINALMRADVLVLDDVGSDRIARDSSAFRTERLALILRHRYNHLLPTVITANVQHIEGIAPGDERLQRRLDDCSLIHLEGEMLLPRSSR